MLFRLIEYFLYQIFVSVFWVTCGKESLNVYTQISKYKVFPNHITVFDTNYLIML